MTFLPSFRKYFPSTWRAEVVFDQSISEFFGRVETRAQPVSALPAEVPGLALSPVGFGFALPLNMPYPAATVRTIPGMIFSCFWLRVSVARLVSPFFTRVAYFSTKLTGVIRCHLVEVQAFEFGFGFQSVRNVRFHHREGFRVHFLIADAHLFFGDALLPFVESGLAGLHFFFGQLLWGLARAAAIR